MAYVSNYNQEYDTRRSGVVLSHPSQTKTIYVQAWLGEVTEAKPSAYWDTMRVYAGDPVITVVSKTPNNNAEKAKNGKIVSYAGIWYTGTQAATEYEEGGYLAITGIALADAKYHAVSDGGQVWYESDPIPIAVEGDVVVTLPSFSTRARGRAGTGTRGHYYAGEYVDVGGNTTSALDKWGESGAHLTIGQIITGKTGNETDADAAVSRLYARPYLPNSRVFYHVAVRLMISPLSSTDAGRSTHTLQNVHNIGERVEDGTMVSLYRRNAEWVFNQAAIEGEVKNGVTLGAIARDGRGSVAVSGQVIFSFGRVLAALRNSRRARLDPVVQKWFAAESGELNDDPPALSSYYSEGIRVNASLEILQTDMPGHQFGIVTDINDEARELTVMMDPVSTGVPAEITNPVELDTSIIPTTTPSGTAMRLNPITGIYEICTSHLDNVDLILEGVYPLPLYNGWDLAKYREYFGNGVFQDENGFWSAVAKFGKGLVNYVLRPVAEFLISAVACKASTYLGPLGGALVSQVATKVGQLIDDYNPTPSNEPVPYRSVYGSMITPNANDDPVIQRYINTSGSYVDWHPNKTIILPAEDTAESTFTKGWEIRKEGDYGRLVKTGFPASKASQLMVCVHGIKKNASGACYAEVLVDGYIAVPIDHESLDTVANFGVGTKVCVAGDSTNRLASLYHTRFDGSSGAVQPRTICIGDVVEKWESTTGMGVLSYYIVHVHPYEWGAKNA